MQRMFRVATGLPITTHVTCLTFTYKIKIFSFIIKLEVRRWLHQSIHLILSSMALFSYSYWTYHRFTDRNHLVLHFSRLLVITQHFIQALTNTPILVTTGSQTTGATSRKKKTLQVQLAVFILLVILIITTDTGKWIQESTVSSNTETPENEYYKKVQFRAIAGSHHGIQVH